VPYLLSGFIRTLFRPDVISIVIGKTLALMKASQRTAEIENIDKELGNVRTARG
jgi:hypothetical protein